MGERLPCKQEVRSSNLLISTIDLTEISDFVVSQVSRSFRFVICHQATNDLTAIFDCVVGQVPFCFKSSICQKTANDFLKVKNDLTRVIKVDKRIDIMNIENRITVYISGQETKGARRMPWHQEAKKDVTSNENLE